MNITLLNSLTEKEPALVFTVVLLISMLIVVFLTLVVIFHVLRGSFNFFEMAHVECFKKEQFFTHAYFKRKRLSKENRTILIKEISFYNRLTDSEKKNFEHRVRFYLKNWEFIGNDIEINDTMRVMIAATAAKLTFGFRHYKIKNIDKVIIYPKVYYSSINKEMHKGEFNMAYKALIFSWEDFLKGYKIADDNINLGVHEFIHAIHFYSLKTKKYSTSAAIFLDSLYELIDMLDSDDGLKERLVLSVYFRDYAFENQFEFISVLVENFVETPAEFRSKFPRIYDKVKEMLNFNFVGY